MIKKNLYVKLVFSLIMVMLFLSACAMKQNIFLKTDGSGNVDFEMKLAPYFTEVASQLSELVPADDSTASPQKDGTFFNIPKLKKDFSLRKGVSLTKLVSPKPDILQGSFTFSDINTAVTDAGKTKNPGIFSFKKVNGESRLSVDISYTTMKALLNENPSLNSPLMENFGPLANKDLSESDYLDMMEYALGKESRQGIKDSRLDIVITVDGTILSQTGGLKINSRRVEFSIPLIKILVLKTPLHYSVTFKE